MAIDPSIRLPRQWPEHVKSGILHAVALASVAMTAVHTRTARRHRLRAELDVAKNEIALLREELGIKDGRWLRSRSRRRPHYLPTQRLRILQLRSARGWTLEKTARVFLIDQHTLKLWIRRVDENGERDLIQTPRPVNRYPAFVRHLVRTLKRLLPAMGSERIAQVLARVGLVLSASTVRRMIREPHEPRSEATIAKQPRRRAVARRPGDVWHVDLTAVPMRAGFWTPWLAFSLPQRWPFCWWVGVVVDQISRRLIAFEVYFKLPSSEKFQTLLDRAIREQGSPPRCIVSDKGSQFKCKSYRRWCRRRNIRILFGYLGEPCSIPIVERFIRSMKQECLRLIVMPPTRTGMLRELRHFSAWYNGHRPHTHLVGRTPDEIYSRKRRRRPRIEPRTRWPHRPKGCVTGRRFALDVSYVAGRKHLPIVKLRHAA
ncbi:MAG: DDE-type integrase/transposase/recombinase [Planctomycetota bacterium]|jgi:transposase InsO family protein